MNRLDKWHKTKQGFAIFGLIELLLAYALASLAIDRGSLWWYLLAAIFLVGSLHNFIKFIGTFENDRHKSKQA